jgi:hypothetical protein
VSETIELDLSPEQLQSLRTRWDQNPYSCRGLFDGSRAVRVQTLLDYLQQRGLTSETAVGWLATMTQTGQLQMISNDLINLGPRAQPLPAWVADSKSVD